MGKVPPGAAGRVKGRPGGFSVKAPSELQPRERRQPRQGLCLCAQSAEVAGPTDRAEVDWPRDSTVMVTQILEPIPAPPHRTCVRLGK